MSATWTPYEPYKLGDVVTMNVVTRPKWWQFWKQPVTEKQQWVVGALGTSDDGVSI